MSKKFFIFNLLLMSYSSSMELSLPNAVNLSPQSPRSAARKRITVNPPLPALTPAVQAIEVQPAVVTLAQEALALHRQDINDDNNVHDNEAENTRRRSIAQLRHNVSNSEVETTLPGEISTSQININTYSENECVYRAAFATVTEPRGGDIELKVIPNLKSSRYALGGAEDMKQSALENITPETARGTPDSSPSTYGRKSESWPSVRTQSQEERSRINKQSKYVLISTVALLCIGVGVVVWYKSKEQPTNNTNSDNNPQPAQDDKSEVK